MFLSECTKALHSHMRLDHDKTFFGVLSFLFPAAHRTDRTNSPPGMACCHPSFTNLHTTSRGVPHTKHRSDYLSPQLFSGFAPFF